MMNMEEELLNVKKNKSFGANSDGTITKIQIPQNIGEEKCEMLWPSPIILAKPFSKEFIDKLREDIKYLHESKEALGNKNSTDLWDLPDLPETMIKVKEKKLELMEKYYRPLCEMPLPPFTASKGYFRASKGDGIYRITPHKHGNTIGVGMLYVTCDKENPGNLVMMDPRGGVNWVNQFTAFKKIAVEEGLMLIHPGYLLHFVEPSNPDMGMHYKERLAIITSLHRTQEGFLQVLKTYDDYLSSIGSGGKEA
jgi:hypothetical protein